MAALRAPRRQARLTVTKSQLIQILSARYALGLSDARLAVMTLLDALGNALASGGRVEVRGFGSFTLIRRGPRRPQNPKTGAPVEVPSKHLPYFKAGKELRERVD